MTIKLMLKDVREQKGMTRKQLARAMGVSRTAIYTRETGRNAITLGRIAQAAEALGCPPSELVDFGGR